MKLIALAASALFLLAFSAHAETKSAKGFIPADGIHTESVSCAAHSYCVLSMMAPVNLECSQANCAMQLTNDSDRAMTMTLVAHNPSAKTVPVIVSLDQSYEQGSLGKLIDAN